MKKLWSILLAVTIIFAMFTSSGCSKNESGSTPESSTPEGSVPSEEGSPTVEGKLTAMMLR